MRKFVKGALVIAGAIVAVEGVHIAAGYGFGRLMINFSFNSAQLTKSSEIRNL